MYKNGNDEYQIQHIMGKLLEVNAKDEPMNANNSFKLKTYYPGLLIGSGYIHGLSNDFDAKLGFYFDHTTGLPLIQGSSIKGMLRSCFGLSVNKNELDKYTTQKETLIRELMDKKELDVSALAKEIFEGIDPITLEQKSIYERDIFYEARVIESSDKLLKDDYITPHGKNPLLNPTPIRFIKVAPNVTFEFNFDLKDSTLATAKEKEKLFITLLEDFGIGAKTNVGYGQLELVLTQEEREEQEKRDAIEERNKKEREKQEKLEQENKGLSQFEIFLKELNAFKKKDNNMVKKIKEYEGTIEDIEKIIEIVNSKEGTDKFHNRIMKHLDSLS